MQNTCLLYPMPAGTENKMIHNIKMEKADIKILGKYKEEAEKEWTAILQYWIKYTPDVTNGGFYGSVNNDNIPGQDAPKGIVLNSRILWTFSASFLHFENKDYLDMAHRAFNYIVDYFIDNEFGGVYWSVDSKGKMLDGRKQIYGLAFCMYAMSEYYKASKNGAALELCKKLFRTIEQYSFDKKNGGYLEAFTREWNLPDDLRLSDKDANEKKTMNTHLHIIEAYANLYTVWPNKLLAEKIAGLLNVFKEYIIDKNSFHLNLFFDEAWKVKSSVVSFGHDIEAAWLLQDCATATGNEAAINEYKNFAVKMADAAASGLDNDGGLWYEYEPGNKTWIKEKHHWPQAEAMVGFMNEYQISGNIKYLQHSLNSWQFIKNKILDKNNGEWFWGVNEDGSIMQQQDKAGFWKCPYHNSRACMEIINRTNEILKQKKV